LRSDIAYNYMYIYMYIYIYISCPQLQLRSDIDYSVAKTHGMSFSAKEPNRQCFAERVLQWRKCDNQTERVGVSSRARTMIKCVQSNCHAV